MTKSTSFMEHVRSLDLFGVDVSLNYRGHTAYNTIFGAFCSVMFMVALAVYFVVQTMAVVNFEEPQINSYEIQEARGGMEEALRLNDMRVDFLYGFFREADFNAVSLDPSIGRFDLTQSNYRLNENRELIYYDNIPVEQTKSKSWNNQDDGDGAYAPKNLSDLHLLGSDMDLSKD